MAEQNKVFASNCSIQDCVTTIIEKEGFVKHEVFVKNVCTAGNNFMGELFEIDIKGVTSHGDKEINLFVKQIINNEDFKVYSIPEVYRKEVYFYNELINMYENIQDEANILPQDRLKFVKSYKEMDENAIILENITKKGYRPTNRFELMSLQFAEMSLKELAKFHSLSFLLEKKKPEYFESKIRTIKQSFIYDEYWNELVKKTCEISIAQLNDESKERIRNYIPTTLEKYSIYMTGGLCSIKCLCHGDYKMNNIMVKEQNGLLVDVLPIDYQQIYYGNPIIDLIYFIFASSDRSFRKQHLYYLKDFYYSAFAEFLNRFDVDVENVYPTKSFDECFHQCLDYALMVSLYFYPFFFASEEATHDGNDDLMEVTIKVDRRMKDRIQGVVDDFIEMGIV
ncbi:unnamed protein product [Leptosia nina]|uniref:CHK kinase-like domain-containing protein n=1 Tax=Leptosia nina TaxID=320188 RepID=A0AAV1J5Y0_9NEOP